MVMVKTETDQIQFDEFYATQDNPNAGVWIGLSDRENPGEMSWNDGDYVGYQNWAVGEPGATIDQFPGGACAYMADSSVNNWMTEICGYTKFGYACEKIKGHECPQGWSFFSSPDGPKCYMFVLNGASHRDWIAADSHCKSIGAELMEIANKEEQFILSTHFTDWNKAGVTRLWLGLRCSVGSDSRAEWRSHSTGYPPSYTEWGANEPPEDCDAKPMYTRYECGREMDNRGEQYDEYYNGVLSCPVGDVIEIISSLYGRANSKICSKAYTDGLKPLNPDYGE